CISTTGIKAEVSLQPRTTPYGESYQVNLEDPFLTELQEKIFNPQGVSAYYCGSVADENVFANRLGIPVVSLGPRGGGCHSCDEWVSLKSMDDLVEMYKEIIKLFNS
ncbi:MAG: hypothetical protein R2772_11890, partial [Chitinophagales bacterium]